MNKEKGVSLEAPFVVLGIQCLIYFFLESNSDLIFFRFMKLMIAIGMKANGKIAVTLKPFFM